MTLYQDDVGVRTALRVSRRVAQGAFMRGLLAIALLWAAIAGVNAASEGASAAGFGSPSVRAAAGPAPSNTVVRFEVVRGTNALGVMEVELFDQEKPETVRNFLFYIRSGAYSNSFIHRAVPGFAVQGGGFTVTNASGTNLFSAYNAIEEFGRVTNEFLVGPRLTNLFGTIAMAKLGDDPNSATSQWFFNLANNSTNLDNQNGGFTVFGRVLASTNATDGTNVLTHFNSLSTNNTIANLGNLISSAYSVFSDLPVAVSNTPPRLPAYTGLYYTRISILNDSYVPGTNGPTLTVTSPEPDSRFTNQVVTISGTASDDVEVARVVYRVNGGAQRIATGTTNWSIPLAPNIGFSTVTVEAVDFDGNRYTNAAPVEFFYAGWVPLNIAVSGNGKVTGVTNGQRVELGKFYTAVSVPGSRQVLDSWTGSVTSTVPALTFLVPTNATNFSLTARFAPSPFIRLAGTYHGIIRSNNPALENSGLVTLSLSSRGSISGRIRHRGGSYRFTGKFDTNYSVTLQGAVGGINRSVSLKLDTTNSAGVITGSVFGNTTAEVVLERLASALPSTNVPPVGNLTFAVADTNALSQLLPGGSGYGFGKIARNGTLTLSGTLGNGVTFKTAAKITRQNRWPLYHSLPRGLAVFTGWVAPVTNQPAYLDGTMIWLASSDTKALNYRSGFTNQPTLLISPYAPPVSGARVVNWVNGQSRITGGNLVRGVTNIVKLSTNNLLGVLDSNVTAFNLSLDLRSGAVRGSFVHPWIGTTNRLQGVILKRAEGIRGLFVDGELTGGLSVNVSPFLLTQSVASVTLEGLTEALKEGGILRFESDGVITLTNTISPIYDTALDANGHNVVIDGGGVRRLVEVQTNRSFAATGVVFANGRVDGANGLTGPLPTEPGGNAYGAGVVNFGGTVALTNCTVTNCIVQGGDSGGIARGDDLAAGGRGIGGAICNLGGSVALNGCLIADNRAEGGVGGDVSVGVSVLSLPSLGAGAALYSVGQVEITNSAFINNRAKGGREAGYGFLFGSVTDPGFGIGGAIVVAGGQLTASSSSWVSNSASGGETNYRISGSRNDGGSGGAIFVETNALATIRRSLFSENTVVSHGTIIDSNSIPGEARGGAIFNAGRLVLRESSMENNTATGGGGEQQGRPAPGRGGGVASIGVLVVDGSTFSGNLANGGVGYFGSTNFVHENEAAGGAIYSAFGTLFVTNSTFSSNRVSGRVVESNFFATAFNSYIPSGNGWGGAIASISNTTVLVHTTIAYNEVLAGVPGNTNSGVALAGGVFAAGGGFSIRASIVATNYPTNFYGSVGDLGYNLSSDNSVALTVTTSVTNVEPRLGTLTTNGGPTKTIALRTGSPALDLVPTSGLPATDQRGVARPAGIIGDAGAFESTETQVPPTFVLQPVGTVVRAGSNYTFQAIATGPAPIGYSWLKNGVLISGATSTSLALSNLQDAATGNYVAVATNAFGSTTSVVAALTVDSRPLLVGEPADASVAPGSPASFVVSVNGPALNYFWFKDGSAITGATNGTLTITNVVLGSQGSYQAVVTNFAGSVTSRVAALTFNSVALNIVAQPVSLTVTQGTIASFSVLASGVPAIAYQWFFGSLPIPEATNSTFSISSVDSTNSGNYRVVVTNDYLALVSSTATLTVVAPSLAPTLLVAAAGPNLEVTCSGVPGASYELLCSTNFVDAASWRSVATGVMPAGGKLKWLHTAPTSGPIYFRAAQQKP